MSSNSQSGRKPKDTKAGLRVSIVAIMTALTVVFTLFVRIPTAKGYLNLCDAAIFFCAFAFGPVATLVSGALGSALADIIGGFPQWAPISLVVHGLEGLAAALILRKAQGKALKFLAAAVGVLISAAGYFLLGGLLTGYEVAVLEILPNVGQSAVGAALGFSAYAAVRKAYPPVVEFKS